MGVVAAGTLKRPCRRRNNQGLCRRGTWRRWIKTCHVLGKAVKRHLALLGHIHGGPMPEAPVGLYTLCPFVTKTGSYDIFRHVQVTQARTPEDSRLGTQFRFSPTPCAVLCHGLCCGAADVTQGRRQGRVLQRHSEKISSERRLKAIPCHAIPPQS